ncbi:MAG: PP2C family protein-serine/threonine phosphatase [Candidatus Acidiferrales bacterium]
MEPTAARRQPDDGAPMDTSEQTYLRAELEERRELLHTAVRAPGADASLAGLLSQVDAALSRMEHKTYGVCTSCQGTIETDRLLSDPLLQVCLGCLTEEEQRALERDLELAARIQRALLPRNDLAPAGWRVRYHYEPAGLVSGDYCDLLETRDGLLFLLGDVSGKGVAASMLMSHLHATFRSLTDAGLPLEQMVNVANRIFCESTLAGQFATLVVGHAARDGAVEFVSAGHLPVLHVHDASATPNAASGVPLGMFADVRFPVQRLSLLPGDTLLLYTDGLTEAENPHGEEYGIDRLQGLAARHHGNAPERLLAECLADLRNFSGGSKRTDDLTILALQHAR